MFLDEEPPLELPIPVCITAEEEAEQKKLNNKSVKMLRSEVAGKLDSVTDQIQHGLFTKEYRKAKNKDHLIALHNKISEYTDIVGILDTDSLAIGTEITNQEEVDFVESLIAPGMEMV